MLAVLMITGVGLIFILPGLLFAAEAEPVEPRILPESPAHSLVVFYERVRFFFAVPSRRTYLRLQQAERRLREAESIAREREELAAHLIRESYMNVMDSIYLTPQIANASEGKSGASHLRNTLDRVRRILREML